ncbi:MAG: hypothetical protein M1815_004312 [Lichina confinis]|nr:MAG: hypothetical protein M1815_004312 [Lichina confinis]
MHLQASEDHRGTPEAPGRVVTLIERSFWEKLVDPHTATADRVWGVAYHVAPARAEEVKAYLDVREVNGYTIHHVPFQPANDDERTIQTMAYIGTPENPQFIGPQGSQALAEHIWKSHGPSGENRDYLFKLEESLNELSPDSEDDHVKDLAERVRRLEVASAAKGDSVRKETPT